MVNPGVKQMYKKRAPQQTGFKRKRTYGQAQRLSMKKELKYFDTALSFTSDQTNEIPATGQLTLIPLGDGPSNRDGRLVRITSVHFKAEIYWGYHTFLANPNGTAIVHFWLVLDRQPNGAAAGVSDVLTNGAGVGTNAYDALPNISEAKRFKILRYWCETLDINGSFVAAGNAATIRKQSEVYVKLPPCQTEFKSSGGTITDVSTNNVFLISGCSLNADDEVTISGTARLRFYDV